MATGRDLRATARHLPILAALVALIALGTVWQGSSDSSSQSATTPIATIATPGDGAVQPTLAPTPIVATPAPVPPSRLTLVAVGDIMLARSIGARVLEFGPSVVFDDEIASLLRSADLTVGNLESAVSERGEAQPKQYTFQAPPDALEALSLAGFDAVSMANNHSLDFGVEALLDAVRLLPDWGIEAVGASADGAKASAPRLLVRNGLRIAFVGLVDVAAEGAGFSRETWEATADRPGVAWADTDSVSRSVRSAAAGADLVVAMLHFGIEYDTTPSPSQRELAHAAIDAGAALVIGSHPHVLQPVEEYGGGLIAYSLGNFVFDGFDGLANESAILRVVLGSDGVQSWELVPVELIDDGLPRLVHP